MNVTLITGASGGIGEAFAHRLAAEKHNLLLVARQETRLQMLCDELTRTHAISAQYIAIDLTEADADQRVFEETQKRGLTVDWLINNAGFGSGGDFAELELKTELQIISLNISALVALTHPFLQPMRQRNSGTIINVASVAAFIPVAFQATYAASKAFVRSFTEAINAENAPFTIRIMLLCPGLTETNFFGAAGINSEKEQVLAGSAQRQTPDEVVEAAMNGLRSKQGKVISGRKNRLLVGASSLMPDALIARSTANQFRAAFQKKTS